MARAQSSAERRTKPEDPFRFGIRYTNSGMVPLKKVDLLHPQEGDFIVHYENHDFDRTYLRNVFRNQLGGKPRLRVLTDHIINFQQGGVQPLGPDVTVLEGEPLDWDGNRGAFPVAEMKSRIVCAIELTSQSTRGIDLREKPALYYRAGVPLMVIVDLPYGGSKKPRGLLVFRAAATSLEPVPLESNGRFWLAAVNVWLGVEDNHVVCYDSRGIRIGGYDEMTAAVKQEKARADEASRLAAEEKARADKAQARVLELEAQLKKAEQSGRRKK